MKLRIVGVQHLSGEKSKKTGKPYDFCLLHCLSMKPEFFDNGSVAMVGYRAETVMCDTAIALDIQAPCVAELYCDRFGRVEEIHVAEVLDTI